MQRSLFAPNSAVPQTLDFGAPPKPEVAFVEKYRPTTLAEVVGHDETISELRAFARSPFRRAFIFAGPTGTGKTSAALALAHDLGCSEFSGLHVIESGEQDAEAVESTLKKCRLSPWPHPLSKGWHCIVVNEADFISTKARNLWLSALENLPAHVVVIFTTNSLNKFETRFIDRCKTYHFTVDQLDVAGAAQRLIDSIWQAETGAEDGPALAALADAIDPAGLLSYRRVVSALEDLIRHGNYQRGAVDPIQDALWAAYRQRAAKGESLCRLADEARMPFGQFRRRLAQSA